MKSGKSLLFWLLSLFAKLRKRPSSVKASKNDKSQDSDPPNMYPFF